MKQEKESNGTINIARSSGFITETHLKSIKNNNAMLREWKRNIVKKKKKIKNLSIRN